MPFVLGAGHRRSRGTCNARRVLLFPCLGGSLALLAPNARGERTRASGLLDCGVRQRPGLVADHTGNSSRYAEADLARWNAHRARLRKSSLLPLIRVVLFWAHPRRAMVLPSGFQRNRDV